ncbi:MAG: hypothetical protein JWM33_130 [Caulobacteraceae bacterium]|nr:hypothetical protein [Caulobacteraceae bacterium]
MAPTQGARYPPSMKSKPAIFLMLAASGLYAISAVHMHRNHPDLFGLAMICTGVALNLCGAYYMWKKPNA